MIAIVADVVHPITRLEIRRVYELGQLGSKRELWFLVVPGTVPEGGPGSVPLRDFIEEIARDFGLERIYHRVTDELDFQASLLVEMMPFVVGRTGSAFARQLPQGGRQ